MKQAAGRGTSRYSIGIKSWPEVIVNWILMKIVFFCHLISHLWQKIAIVLAIFGHFWHDFSDFLPSVTQLCSKREPIRPDYPWPMWGDDSKPFRDHWALNPWLGGIKNGPFGTKNGLSWQACQCPDVVQKGPKWSQMVNITCFWPFGTFLGSFGPFWTISDKTWFFAPNYFGQEALCVFEAKNWFLS